MKNYTFITKIDGLDKKALSLEIQEVIKTGWGDFGADYIDNHVLTASHFIIAKKGEKVVGFASARKIMFQKKPIYCRHRAKIP